MSNKLKQQLWFNYLHRVNQPARQLKKPKRKIIRKEQPSYVQSNNH